jgi:hypothetical protein
VGASSPIEVEALRAAVMVDGAAGEGHIEARGQPRSDK